MRRVALFASYVVLASSAVAQQSQIKNVDVVRSDAGSAAIALTQSEKSLAKQWMLTEADWVRYKEVMRGPRGILSPGLDPITALGVETDDPAERRRLADVWMKFEAERTRKELAFEVERMQAGERMFGNQPVMDGAKFANLQDPEPNVPRFQVMLFTDGTCVTDECKEQIGQLVASMGDYSVSRLHVFFPASTTSESIGDWASQMGIETSTVKAGLISLNYEDGMFVKYDIKPESLPEVRVKDLVTGDVRATFTQW